MMSQEGATEYLKVGERWGKLTLLSQEKAEEVVSQEKAEEVAVPTDIAKSTDENQQQQATRRSSRRQAKASEETEGIACF